MRILKNEAYLPYAAMMKDTLNADIGIFTKPSQLGSRMPGDTSPPDVGEPPEANKHSTPTNYIDDLAHIIA